VANFREVELTPQNIANNASKKEVATPIVKIDDQFRLWQLPIN
jgi:hypothetical protein